MSNTVSVVSGLLAHRSGALWIPDSKTVLIADAHLGYSWAQRRRGELGPLADFETREKLFFVCKELGPRAVVFVGDLVHAPRPCDPERQWIEETLNELSQFAKIIVVRGNHDRGFAMDFAHLGLQIVETWSQDPVTAIHGDQLPSIAIPDSGALVMGHLHPAFPVHDATGASEKLPVFLANSHCIVLPAFSPFAKGYNVACGLSEDLKRCFGPDEIHAYVTTGTRILHLGSLRAVIERMFAADTSSPAQFRKMPHRSEPRP